MVDVPKPISQLDTATKLVGFLVGYDPSIPLANQRTVRYPVGLFKGDQGLKGDTGATGAKGDPGANGVGVPVGGTTGQVLAKKSNTDFDTVWVAQASGGGSTTPLTINQKRRYFADFTEGRSYPGTSSISESIPSGGGFSYFANGTSFQWTYETSYNDTNFNGVLIFYTGSTASISAKFGTMFSAAGFKDNPSKYETSVKFLANISDDINVFFGFDARGNSTFRVSDTTNPAVGFFVASNSPVPANYSVITRKVTGGFSQTIQDTGIPYNSGSPAVLKIEVTKSTAKFYINGTLTNTITTNIDPETSRPLHIPSVSISRTTGTTSVGLLNLDYIEFIPDMLANEAGSGGSSVSAPANVQQRRRIFSDFTNGCDYNLTNNVITPVDGGFGIRTTDNTGSVMLPHANTVINGSFGAVSFTTGTSASYIFKLASFYTRFVPSSVISKYEVLTRFRTTVPDNVNVFFGMSTKSTTPAVRVGDTVPCFGFIVAPNTPTPANFAAIVYQSSAAGSGKTLVDTGIPYNNNANAVLKMEISNTSVKFYINGTLTNTITTNIDTTAEYCASIDISRTSGTTAVSLFDLDYIEFIPDTTWWGKN